MGVNFVSASSTFLTTTTAGDFPTTFPFTVGFWFKINTAGVAQCVWAIHETGTAGFNVMRFALTAADALQFFMDSSATGPFTLTLTGGYTQGQWCHAIIRYISATDYRVTVRSADGKFVAASGASSYTPSSIGQMSIGKQHYNSEAANNLNGDVADFFRCDADIGVAGTDLTLAEHMALMNPTEPRVFTKLRSYWSFRAGWEQRQPPGFISVRGSVPIQWTPSATPPIAGLHPPWSVPDLNARRASFGFVPVAGDTLFAQSVM